MKPTNKDIISAVSTIGLILPTVKDNRQTYDMLTFFLRRLLEALCVAVEGKENKPIKEPRVTIESFHTPEQKKAVAAHIIGELDNLARNNGLKIGQNKA